MFLRHAARTLAAAPVIGGAIWAGERALCHASAAPAKANTDASLQKPADFSLTGRTALVTGGSKGLGKAIARGFALAGADVVITARSESELRVALREILAGTSRKGEYIVCDLSDREQASALGPEVLRRMGRCDIFVNNAGISTPGTVHKGASVREPIPPMADSDWRASLDVNLSAGVTVVNALAPQMVERGWGRIVHVSSIGGLGSSEGRTAYSATKAALIGVTNASALELGPHGVTVNVVAPGPFLTDMPLTKLPPHVRETVAAKIPLKRWGRPEEMVGPLLMLVSEAGSYVNGAMIRIDGGVLSRAY